MLHVRHRLGFVGLGNLALVGLLALTGCPAADSTTGSKTPVLGLTAHAATGSFAQAPLNNQALVNQVLALVNDRRTRIGLPEVTLNPVLTRMAEDYCREMIENDFFEHSSPSGEGPGERAYKAGYVFLAIGENLAAGQETAEQVVEEWMHSPEHREIILGTQWREIGIGVRIGGEHDIYWVLEFGNPP